MLCIDYYAACQRKIVRIANRWNDCHPRAERPRQQAQGKKYVGVGVLCVHALFELATWLQAGEDRAIAAGSQAD
jgi:hypothetical protein